jgi:hypothetical protein
VLWARGVSGDERQIDFCFDRGRELDLGLLGSIL